MHIEPVQIRGPRAAIAAVLQAALEFGEEGTLEPRWKSEDNMYRSGNIRCRLRGRY
jgi:hypothetical protein